MAESPADAVEMNDGEDRIIPLYSLLPPVIRRKVRALKKLQLQTLQVSAQFYLDLHKLEKSYADLNADSFSRRANIVSGKVEPTEEECALEEGYESPDDSSPGVQELRSKLGITRALESGTEGIPEFWLTALKNVELTADLVQLHDEPILRHLTDIRVTLNEPIGFTLDFHFSPNPYFTNLLLTKQYVMKCGPDVESPWDFEGPEISEALGCGIDWKEGMDVTRKTVQKKSKGGAVVRTIRNDSFFNFFDPPKVPSEPPEGYPLEEVLSTLELDYEMGSFLKEKLVPQAVLYYTGEALDDESSSEESGSEEGGGDCVTSEEHANGDAGSDYE